MAKEEMLEFEGIVEELLTNVLCHGSGGRDVAFRIELTLGSEGLLFALEDDGDPFDPRSAPEVQMPNAERGGGVALALVRAWTEVVSYDSVAGRNRLVLRFRSQRGSGA